MISVSNVIQTRPSYSNHEYIHAAARKFCGVDANIPDLPHIIMTPVNLRYQWESEIKRFLVPAAFDLFPYVGRHEHRTTWWDDLFDKSKQPLSQRIILATQTVSIIGCLNPLFTLLLGRSRRLNYRFRSSRIEREGRHAPRECTIPKQIETDGIWSDVRFRDHGRSSLCSEAQPDPSRVSWRSRTLPGACSNDSDARHHEDTSESLFCRRSTI